MVFVALIVISVIASLEVGVCAYKSIVSRNDKKKIFISPEEESYINKTPDGVKYNVYTLSCATIADRENAITNVLDTMTLNGIMCPRVVLEQLVSSGVVKDELLIRILDEDDIPTQYHLISTILKKARAARLACIYESPYANRVYQ
jgi:hypothetical protein